MGSENSGNKSVTSVVQGAADCPADADRANAALSLIIAKADWEKLEEFFSREVPIRLSQGKYGEVAGWLDKVPPAVLEQHAGMCYWLGAARMPMHLAESRLWYERAYALYCARQDGVGQLLSWAAIVETIFLEWGDFSMLRSWIVVGEQLLDESGDLLTGEIEQRAVGAMFNALMHGQPDHPDIGTWGQRLFDLLRRVDDDSQRLLLGAPLFIYYTKWLGMHARAEIVLDMLRPAPERFSLLNPMARILLSMSECTYHWNRYAIAASNDAIQDGMETAERTDLHAWDFLLHTQPVYAGLSSGDPVLASKYLNRLRELLPRRAPLEQSHYHYLAGWQAMLLDDPHRALEHMNHCSSLVNGSNGPMQHALNCIALAQVHHALGEDDKIPPLLADARKMAGGAGSPLLEFMACYSEAAFALDRHNDAACLTALGKALALSSKHDYLNFSWCLPPVLTRLCIKAMEANIETGFVRRLIRIRNIVPDIPPMHLEHWPWPLKVYTLGHFAIFKDDVPVSFSRKAKRKPLEMLKALIALGGREVSEERLSDILWPDGEGDHAHSSFTTTLSRLRKLVGDDSLCFRDGRLSLDARRCWVDAWALQGTLGEMQLAIDADRMKSLARKVIALYRGPFLNDDDGALWLRGLRGQLRKQLVNNVVACALNLIEAGSRHQAVALCHQVLAVDSQTQELFERFAMRHSGRTASDLLQFL